MEVFSMKNKNKIVEKIEQKKDIILKVKIRKFDLDMQMDTGSEVTLIPKKILGTHWKNNFTKEQFTTLSVWWGGHENFLVLWRFFGVRR